MLKRPIDLSVALIHKRPRTDITVADRRKEIIPAGNLGSIPRTSNLKAPNMLLTGHKGEIFCGNFEPKGSFLATAGQDREIFFWDTYGDCDQIAALKSHTGAVMDIKFSTDGEWLYSASSDKTVMLWDTRTGDRLKKFKGHSGIVNCICVEPDNRELFSTGSDDYKVRLWDKRCKKTLHTLDARYPVLDIVYSKNSEYIFSGGIENVINQWDLRQQKIVRTLPGHNDSITGLSISNDGNFLLSNSADNTLRAWDVRPFSKNDRCLKIMLGHHHNFEKNLLRCSWSSDDRRVTCGSSDRSVYVWDMYTGQIMYKLPGHVGSVNETAFHPTEPILLSVGSDMKIYMGEIQPA